MDPDKSLQQEGKPEQGKNDRIREISTALTSAFPTKEPLSHGEVNRHTNDAGLEKVWQEVSRLLEGNDELSQVRLGVIVGAGGAPSIYAELLPSLDILAFLDQDQRALDWIKFTTDTLERTKTLDAYHSRVYNPDNPLLQGQGTNLGASSYIDEAESLGKYHLLDSSKRYTQTRNALVQAKATGKQILYLPMDLRDPSSATEFSSLVGPESSITYANFTNVAFHVVVNAINPQKRFSLDEATQGFRDTLQALPFNERSIIQYSKLLNRRELPQANFTRGIETYLSDALVMPQA